ncbi:hypothetical protein nbrc107696_01950 [Gordonia spumicola]|uniref:Mce associated membrane protein n=1 Tax=Gordonia spumicola TaxID=589161 RepID=A0A7I9V2W9_9ACTN|nr:hypothetical protein [Gordonia spumicola]GED99748.1 hypothetical protein nbrc107696_01950 [Gordonia spumicola]
MKSDDDKREETADEVVADDAASTETVGLTKSDDAESVPVELSKTDEADDVDDSADEADAETADDADDAEGSDSSDSETETVATAVDDASSRHWLASAALAAASAALVAAVVCLGYFGYVGIRAYAVDSQRDQVRSGAVDGAEQAILNTFTVDPAHMDAWQKRVASSLTGDALKQAVDESAQGVIKQVEAAKDKANSIKVRIISSAATEVNADEETAKVLVLSEATASSAPDQPTGQSYLVTMVKADGLWKASVIVPLSGIAYDDSSSTPILNNNQGGGN